MISFDLLYLKGVFLCIHRLAVYDQSKTAKFGCPGNISQSSTMSPLLLKIVFQIGSIICRVDR